MKAIVLKEPRQFQRAEIDPPADPGPGEALVQVHRVGICGTDISGYLGRMPFYSYPRIPGHELGVDVLATGPDVTEIVPGDRCAVEPYMNCQSCFACQQGNSNCCQQLQVLGVHTDGGLRTSFVVPARKLHRSDQLSWEQLALVETLSIGCHAVERAAAQPGQHALIIGAGPIGLSVMEFARLADLRIIVLDINPQRLQFCVDTMGVEHVIHATADGDPVEQLKDITEGALPSVAFDATGNSSSMSQALRYVAHTGKLVFVGIVTDEIRFPHPVMHAPELTLLASRNSRPADFRRIIQLIADGQIDTRPWITHRTAFDDMIDNFPDYIKPETGVIKAIVEMD